MQDTLEDALLKAQRHSSSAAVHGDISNPGSNVQDEDERPQQDQGNHEQQQQPAEGAGGDRGASGPPAGGGSDKQQQQQQQQQQQKDTGDGSSDEQDEAGPGSSCAAAACLPELPDDKCVRLRLSSMRWPDHGLHRTCLLEESMTDEEKLTAKFKVARDGVQLELKLRMEACIKREEDCTVVGFKLSNVEAKAQAFASTESSQSTSKSSGSSSSGGSSHCAFMYLVRLSMGAREQQPDARPGSVGQELDMELSNSSERVKVSIGNVDRTLTYKFKEITLKAGLNIGTALAGLSGMLGADLALKETEAGARGTELPLVTLDPAAQAAVGKWGDSSPCTVQVVRHPLNTRLCGESDADLCEIKSNPGNKQEKHLGFKMYPSEDCLEQQGQLRKDALKVQLAVVAVGGVFKGQESSMEKEGNMRQLAVHVPDGIVAGMEISIGSPWLSKKPAPQPRWECSLPGCKVHAPKP